MKNLEAIIVSFAKAAIENGLNVDIDRSLPSVALYFDFEESEGFRFQAEKAQSLIDEADKAVDSIGVTQEQYLAYIAQSW